MQTRLLLGFVVLASLIFALTFKGPSITGYVPHETFSKRLDIHIEKSQKFYLQGEEAFSLTRVAMSGSVEGSGLVNVYLINPVTQERLLLFTNKIKNTGAMQFITGMAPLELVAGEDISTIESVDYGFVTSSGAFANECEQTCLLDNSVFTANKLTFEFVIEPGAALDITEIRYTLAG